MSDHISLAEVGSNLETLIYSIPAAAAALADKGIGKHDPVISASFS